MLADLTEEEKFLYSILMDSSGIDSAELLWLDNTSDDDVFRSWDFQVALWRNDQKLQVDLAGRSIGKSTGVTLRAFAHPFVSPGEEMLIGAPEMIFLDPLTKAVERRINGVRLSREMLKTSATSQGFTHRPFEATFRNGARIVGRIPQADGRGFKGQHPLKLEIDEGQDLPAAAWMELIETLKYGKGTGQWRVHGVTKGIRDYFFKITQPGSGWFVHRITAMHREDWSDGQRAAKAEMYGSRNHPDFKRNILGEHSDASSSLFVLSRLMNATDQVQTSEYNTETYYNLSVHDERLREDGAPIEMFLNFPRSHEKWKRTWVGMDVGMVQHPTEILVFGEDWAQGSGAKAVRAGRLRLLTRLHLERITAPDQRAVMDAIYEFYRPQAFAMDRSGLGLPIYSEVMATQSPLSKVLHGYNFSEKIPVGQDYRDGVEQDGRILANVLEFSSDVLRELVDSSMIYLPWDLELLREFQGSAFTMSKSVVDSYGRRRNFSKGGMHALDAARMVATSWKVAQIGDLGPAEEEFEPVFDSFV